MTLTQKIISTVLVAGILVSMTMPLSLANELPGAVVDSGTSSVVARIGVVTEVKEADNITVKISGSDVLVRASYLFPQYQPLLGDRVYVTRQDAQWFVLGTMAGPINSVLANPSFEEGTLGATPDDWSITVVSAAGGAPTFTKVQNGSTGISGSFLADFGVDSVVAGTSSADVFSAFQNAAPNTRWTAGYHLVQTFIDNDNVTFTGGGGFSSMEMFIQFWDGGAMLAETSMNFMGMNYDLPVPTYRRATAPQFTVSPAGTTRVRLRIRGTFTMGATNFTSWFMDYMILRQV